MTLHSPSSAPGAADVTADAAMLLTALTGAPALPVLGVPREDTGMRSRAVRAMLRGARPLARALLRYPALKSTLIRGLARFPRLYALGYRTMLRPDASADLTPDLPATMTPRARTAYGRLQAWRAAEPACE